MKLDLKALKEAAEKATQGLWVPHFPRMISSGGRMAGSDYPIYDVDDSVGVYASINCQWVEFATGPTFKWTYKDEERNEVNNLKYITTANPATILSLIDRLERYEKANRILTEAVKYFVARCTQFDHPDGYIRSHKTLGIFRESLNSASEALGDE